MLVPLNLKGVSSPFPLITNTTFLLHLNKNFIKGCDEIAARMYPSSPGIQCWIAAVVETYRVYV